MIVVDTSVWVDYLIGADTPQAALLDVLIDSERLIVGDLVLCELLQGVDGEAEAARIEAFLRRFEWAEMLDASIAIRAAANYRILRRLGSKMRKTVDVIIGTFCIDNRMALLHSDRDFERMERHLGLQIVRVN